MFSHVMLGSDDLDASKKFYDAVLGALGYPPGNLMDIGGTPRLFYMTPKGTFAITKPIDGEPATHGNGSTIGFAAATTELADAFHAAGLANGGTAIESPPGVRGAGSPMEMYLCYLRDPSGNKVCALKRMA